MLLAMILHLAGSLILAGAARRVSEYRGESDGFWWGFWLNWIGLLVVIFRRSAVEAVRPAPAGSSARQSWLCGKCGARNKAANTHCFACGHTFEN